MTGRMSGGSDAAGVLAPKLRASELISQHVVSLSVLVVVFLCTGGLAVWLFGSATLSNFAIYAGGTLVGVGICTILVWAALFVPVYVNPYRTWAIEQAHPGSKVWANYVTKDLVSYAGKYGDVAQGEPRSRSKGFISVGDGALVFWRRDGSLLAPFLSIPMDAIRSAAAEDVLFGPDPQPGLILSVATSPTATVSVSLLPAPRGLERRGRTATEVANLISGK